MRKRLQRQDTARSRCESRDLTLQHPYSLNTHWLPKNARGVQRGPFLADNILWTMHSVRMPIPQGSDHRCRAMRMPPALARFGIKSQVGQTRARAIVAVRRYGLSADRHRVRDSASSGELARPAHCRPRWCGLGAGGQAAASPWYPSCAVTGHQRSLCG